MIEPMIEPIFVILGILASLAIPRLAATREDAEISAAVANLRTLVSDASAYYTVKGTFANAKWSDITNVPLVTNNVNNSAAAILVTNVAATTPNANSAYLKVGDKSCIGVRLVNKGNNNIPPAYIQLTKVTGVAGSACAQVQNAKPLQPYFNSTVKGTASNITSAIAIGSNTSVY